jgi:hypothetical protein
VIEAAHRHKKGDEDQSFEVWEDNWTSVFFFLEYASTQWQVAVGMSQPAYFGLRYEGIEAAMRMNGVRPKERAALLADLNVMARAALPILNKPTGK